MREQGLLALDHARRKAVERLGITNKRCWPDNAEIQAALEHEYQLFQPEAQQQVTSTLHEQALAAMQTFAEFDPRLVGQSLSGTASLDQGVRLHLFADDPRQIVFRLIDRGIPWQAHDRQHRYADGSRQMHPTFAFVAGEIPVELVVLPERARRNPPLSPISERPERGLNADAVERLLQKAADPNDANDDGEALLGC
ncbi:hypothetical protein CKO42_14770 [Lamprobacter modestohalophilus]|uniref:Uncharacterized protein n=1 Tax=Lamprobacter modestohalophilus TaxID=1064514 RepID=A0A9X1B5C9_9GAMM|nr:hypothetical protein [Lamprobacter modestohalophilus]MBK1619681.1 hypothetical protein [Lamprobacter modestohalophilus]